MLVRQGPAALSYTDGVSHNPLCCALATLLPLSSLLCSDLAVACVLRACPRIAGGGAWQYAQTVGLGGDAQHRGNNGAGPAIAVTAFSAASVMFGCRCTAGKHMLSSMAGWLKRGQKLALG